MDPTPTVSPCVITLGWLQSVKACDEQVDLFTATFGYSTEVTSENLEKAREVGLNLSWLACNQNTPPEILSRLAQDTDANVRWYAARNPNTPPEVLLRLAQDTDEDVRWYAARNPNTPPHPWWRPRLCPGGVRSHPRRASEV
jgi:hypothetical protein